MRGDTFVSGVEDASVLSASSVYGGNPITLHFGRKEGVSFERAADFQSIGIRSGGLIDCLIIDGEEFGGPTGAHHTTLGLSNGEYISAFSVGWCKKSVYTLRFVTNKGRSIHAGKGRNGNDFPSHFESFNNIRVVKIGGRYENLVNCVSISFLTLASAVPLDCDRILQDTGAKSTTLHFGRKEGTQFQKFTDVSSIGLRSGSLIDRLTVDDHHFGGSGGYDVATLEMADDEYISAFSVGWGKYVFSLRFVTNKGQTIHGGEGHYSFKDRPVNFETFNNIRVVGVSGWHDQFLNCLSISFEG